MHAQPCAARCHPLNRLRREHGIEAGIPIVLSMEKARCDLVYHGEEGANPLDYQVRGGQAVV